MFFQHNIFLSIALTTCTLSAQAAVIQANPDNYRDLLNQLQPGDTMQFAPGTYTLGLPLQDMHGTAEAPIVFAGSEVENERPLFTARSCCNTISLADSSYLEIRNLNLDGLGMAGVDAVKAESTATSVHHITLENLFITGHDTGQQTVGISTKCPAWNWVVRGNVINSAGTGMYFGNSDGSAEFFNSIVEGNLVVDTVGYNIQIKHQNTRPQLSGAPSSGKTIIRHNVFSKANNASTGGNARPNLLVGHWPLSGNGADDFYEIYGNFFHQNPTGEPLFQGEGNIALYNNVFFNSVGPAAWIQQHNDLPRNVSVFNNTVVARDTGIRISSVDTNFTQRAIGNAAFAGTPLTLDNAVENTDNITDNVDAASNYLVAPEQFNVAPLSDQLSGTAINSSNFVAFTDWNRDFIGVLHDGTRRGAYSGEGNITRWLPQLTKKPLPPVAAVTGTDSSVVLDLKAYGDTGISADWWLVASVGATIYSYDLVNGWQAGLFPTFQGPLFDLPNIPLGLNGLPTGNRVFYFGVDRVMNGELDVRELFFAMN